MIRFHSFRISPFCWLSMAQTVNWLMVIIRGKLTWSSPFPPFRPATSTGPCKGWWDWFSESCKSPPSVDLSMLPSTRPAMQTRVVGGNCKKVLWFTRVYEEKFILKTRSCQRRGDGGQSLEVNFLPGTLAQSRKCNSSMNSCQLD